MRLLVYLSLIVVAHRVNSLNSCLLLVVGPEHEHRHEHKHRPFSSDICRKSGSLEWPTRRAVYIRATERMAVGSVVDIFGRRCVGGSPVVGAALAFGYSSGAVFGLYEFHGALFALAPTPDETLKSMSLIRSNKPAAGNAGIASQLRIECHCPACLSRSVRLHDAP